MNCPHGIDVQHARCNRCGLAHAQTLIRRALRTVRALAQCKHPERLMMGACSKGPLWWCTTCGAIKADGERAYHKPRLRDDAFDLDLDLKTADPDGLVYPSDSDQKNVIPIKPRT